MDRVDATTAANRLGLDYRREATRLGPPPVAIIDSHAHINGGRASAIYRDVCDLFGVERVHSQTQIDEADAVRTVMGDRIRFVATPRYNSPDRLRAMTTGFLDDLERWHAEYGARMVKIWNAPRWRDLIRAAAQSHPVPGITAEDLIALDSPWRRRIMDRAVELGMSLMAHIADPDTWFATKYADASVYGTKLSHLEALERMLEAYRVPWMVAHLGGWPENLDWLDGLMERHPHLTLDTSATKWMVRELSRYPLGRVAGFLSRWRGRVFFGSDIVVADDHLVKKDVPNARFAADLANSPEEAFELYASRYWALRVMWETGYEGPSNIADPDLAMVEPGRFGPMDAPALRGQGLSVAELGPFYRGSFEAWLRATGG